MARVFGGDDLRDTAKKIEAAMDAKNKASDALKAVKKAARARGYDMECLNTAIKEHRTTNASRAEQKRKLVELYRQALGLTPIEEIMAAGDDPEDDAGDAEGDGDDAPGRAAENGAGAALQ
jgi:uncharacterized protein (UPF0335 family)